MIQHTKSAAHTHELAKQAVVDGVDILVAVGGDGTINNIAQHLVHTNVALGIIPLGSGNGLARHLGIPLDPEQAIRIINSCYTTTIDTGTADKHFFLNVAGVGFDAHVSGLFASSVKRGLLGYATITLREFAKYKFAPYTIRIDGKEFKRNAFIICIANGSQYGNNAFIAPAANTHDAMFNVCLIKPFKFYQMPRIVFDLFRKFFSKSRFTENFKGSQISITRPEPGMVNIDGEPILMEATIHISMYANSLNIIVPKNEQYVK